MQSPFRDSSFSGNFELLGSFRDCQEVAFFLLFALSGLLGLFEAKA
jgi:hypothetical protein